jgi:hypothetical protein
MMIYFCKLQSSCALELFTHELRRSLLCDYDSRSIRSLFIRLSFLVAQQNSLVSFLKCILSSVTSNWVSYSFIEDSFFHSKDHRTTDTGLRNIRKNAYLSLHVAKYFLPREICIG